MQDSMIWMTSSVNCKFATDFSLFGRNVWNAFLRSKKFELPM